MIATFSTVWLMRSWSWSSIACNYVGNYSAYVTARTARLEQQRKAYEQQQAEIQRQEEFIRRNMAGQNTKQAQSRQKALQRLERVEKPTLDNQRMQLRFTMPQRESHEVIVGRQVWKSYGDRTVLRGSPAPSTVAKKLA